MIDQWHSINFVSKAHAEDAMEEDNWLRNEVGGLAQGKWPSSEIFKATLAGAAGVAVRLAKEHIGSGQISAGRSAAVLGDVASLESAVVIGAPLVAAIGVGIVVGLAADKAYNWIAAKNLGESTSMRDLYDRLVEPTRYSEESSPEVPDPSVAISRKNSRKASRQETGYVSPGAKLKALAAMSAKLDKEEFDQELKVIDACTNKGDYACAEDHVAKASKLASSYTDNELLSAARRRISKHKNGVASVANHSLSTDVNDNNKLVYDTSYEGRAKAPQLVYGPDNKNDYTDNTQSKTKQVRYQPEPQRTTPANSTVSCSDAELIGTWSNSSSSSMSFTESSFTINGSGCNFQYEACNGVIVATPANTNYRNCGAQSQVAYSISNGILKFGNTSYHK